MKVYDGVGEDVVLAIKPFLVLCSMIYLNVIWMVV